MRSQRGRVIGPYLSKASQTMRRIVDERGGPSAVARELGVSHPTVSDWCSAKKRPKGENIKLIEQWSRPIDPANGSLGAPQIPRIDWELPAQDEGPGRLDAREVA